jgi:hypothetical protein
VKVVAALLLVALIGCALTITSLSALRAQVPTNLPFGVTGASPVVTAAESQKISGYQVSFVNTLYANENDAMNAINQGKIYGAYITGTSSDTLIAVPAKSFFALTEIVPVFAQTAAKLGRPLTVKQVKPLPAGKDPIGAVTGLLMLPAIVGGLLAAILVFKSTGAAAQRWRVAILLGYSLLGALLTLVIAGPVFGAFAGDRFWPLLLCLLLLEATVALVTAMLIALLPGVVAMLMALVVFIVVGLPSAGTSGVALLPNYWQAIGGALPPRYGGELIQNVLYFSSNNITTPVVVLAVWLLIPAVVLGFLDVRAWRAPAPASQGGASQPGGARGRLAVRIFIGALLVAALEQCLFASNYVSSAHNPVSRNMPFAVVGNSPLTSAAQKNVSLKVTSYSSESAAKNAIDQAKAWGALIPGTGTNPSTLLVVPTISDLAPLNLDVAFTKAAKAQGQKLTTSSYTPKPLASGDPFGIVLSILLTPLLICGYMASTMLRTATGTAAERYRGLILLGYAVAMALLLDLIACSWFSGYPTDKFWVVWPILALILLVVGLFAAVLQRLVGAAGTLLTVVIIILFGKPSSGGANGVPYLPGFWTAIGPYLPPRNAYILLRNTVYFGGNGTAQALIVLLAYAVVFAAILGILDWYRRPAPELPITRETEAQAAAAAIPAGVAI